MYFSRHYLVCWCYIVKWQNWISNRKEHYPHFTTQNNSFSTKDYWFVFMKQGSRFYSPEQVVYSQYHTYTVLCTLCRCNNWFWRKYWLFPPQKRAVCLQRTGCTDRLISAKTPVIDRYSWQKLWKATLIQIFLYFVVVQKPVRMFSFTWIVSTLLLIYFRSKKKSLFFKVYIDHAAGFKVFKTPLHWTATVTGHLDFQNIVWSIVLLFCFVFLVQKN